MTYRGKHLFFETGYNIQYDVRYGVRLGFARRIAPPGAQQFHFVISWGFDRPVVWWKQEAYAVNEPGYVKGIPVARQGTPSSAWTGRDQFLGGWRWPHFFSWSFQP